VKDASQTDGGDYTCSLKTEPPQFFTVPVIMQTPVISDLPSEVVRWDVSECCQAKGVPTQCMPLCHTMAAGFNVFETLRVSDQCRQHHDQWFRCLASERNHTPCCKRRHVPEKCLDLCLGNFSTVFREGNLQCLHFVGVIFKCFHDGRDSIPSPPRNLRVAPVGADSLRVSWSPPLKHGKELNYTVFYRAVGKVEPGLVGGTKAVSTVALGLILTSLVAGEVYRIHVVALNTAGSSQSSEVVTMEIVKPISSLMDTPSSSEIIRDFESMYRLPIKC
jgi:DB module/Fibronectin type III domain